MQKLLPLIALVVVTGCSEITEGNEEKMHLWFKWGTELSLPAGAQFIGGKNYSIYLSDIFLKLKVQKELAHQRI